ncbi:hypothetical protein T265_08035 [Opisthorchis viverrini]|uniref:Uncharacterized protein n=1 Tax=Opisthorchis viverrini TaxID=6198 RepID=A0A074ZAV4_OPIVI|nr:hypothetical protein T265_08035 [Opisthorchis viverrini]KER24243.1 hypothetical protein T265_08035 [Opisthorchis viverrini]
MEQRDETDSVAQTTDLWLTARASRECLPILMYMRNSGWWYNLICNVQIIENAPGVPIISKVCSLLATLKQDLDRKLLKVGEGRERLEQEMAHTKGRKSTA